MLENRKNPRYQTLARARIPGIMEGENLLKDLSITGCCVESTVNTEIQEGIHYKLEVKPESASRIKNFQLVVERKWVRPENYATEIGFSIIESPKGRQFQRYVDYLSYRNSAT